jgi:hypothetical protein
VLTKGLGHSTALRINRCERFPVRKLDPKKRRAVVKGRSWLIMFKIPAKMPGMRGWLQGVCARGGSMKALAHVRTGSNAVVTRVPMVRAVAGSVLVRPGLAWPGFGLSGIGGGAGGARVKEWESARCLKRLPSHQKSTRNWMPCPRRSGVCLASRTHHRCIPPKTARVLSPETQPPRVFDPAFAPGGR